MASLRTNGDPTPVYYRLQMKLKGEIEEGRWRPGEPVPTERRLAESYGLSIGTVKKALLNLVADGYLYRIQGKGTFVKGTSLRRGSLRYYRMLDDFGGEDARLSVSFLEMNQTKGVKGYHRHLKLRPNHVLYELKRLFFLDSKPVVYTVSYLPCNLFKGLAQQPQTFFEKITLYEALEREYGLTTVNNHQLLGAVPAEGECAGALKVTEGTPLLFVEMISYTYQDKPYEYRLSYCITDERRIFVDI